MGGHFVTFTCLYSSSQATLKLSQSVRGHLWCLYKYWHASIYCNPGHVYICTLVDWKSPQPLLFLSWQIPCLISLQAGFLNPQPQSLREPAHRLLFNNTRELKAKIILSDRQQLEITSFPLLGSSIWSNFQSNCLIWKSRK